MEDVMAGLGAEIRRLGAVVAGRWRSRGVGGFLLTVGVVVAIVAMWVLDHTASRAVVASCCGERLSQGMAGALLRLPGSMVAPAPMLPVWGSVVQVVLAFGLAEAVVGVRRTITVALIAHVISTAVGHVLVWYAPATLGGLPTSWRSALDTGPSAATVGLAVYLALLLGCPRLGIMVLTAIVVPFAIRDDLAGREHMVAILVGAACAGVQLLFFRRAAREPGTIGRAELAGLQTSGTKADATPLPQPN